MPRKLTIALLLFLCLVGLWAINACKSKPAVGTDKMLYDLCRDTTGFVWFNHTDTLLNKSEGSAHPFPFIRTRFNTVAATRLDSNGRVVAGSWFADGSLIVKEMFDKKRTLKAYTTLYKSTGHKDADPYGWVWNAVSTEGNAEKEAAKKGRDCTSCHQEEGNIDNILMNKYFPE